MESIDPDENDDDDDVANTTTATTTPPGGNTDPIRSFIDLSIEPRPGGGPESTGDTPHSSKVCLVFSLPPHLHASIPDCILPFIRLSVVLSFHY